MLLSEAFGDFLRYMKLRRGASVTTIDTYSIILKWFVDFMGNKPVSELKLSDIDDYADFLHGKGYKPKTYRNKLSAVKSFINYLWVKDLITFRPDQIIMPKIKETDQPANFLSPKEVKQLLKCCRNVRDRAMLMTLIYTAVRVSEFTDLRIEDLYQRSIIVRNGKGGKRRVVFINQETEEAINQYLATQKKRTHGYLFPNPEGNRLSRVLVARKVHYYGVLSGVQKKVTTHTLRHTGLTLLLWGGARVEDAQQIAGHANIRTTMIYLHFTNEGLHDSYDEAHAKLKAKARKALT